MFIGTRYTGLTLVVRLSHGQGQPNQWEQLLSVGTTSQSAYALVYCTSAVLSARLRPHERAVATNGPEEFAKIEKERTMKA